MRDYDWYKHPDRSKLSPPSGPTSVPTWRQIGIRALIFTAASAAFIAVWMLVVVPLVRQ